MRHEKNINEPQPEVVRNRLLRRVDWRFLLPNPNPVKSICFAGGLLANALELISDCMVDIQYDCSSCNCDLAVAIDPTPAILRTSWSALSPGGSYYTEWYSFLTGGPSGIRERLEEVGFEDVTCYLPMPSPSHSFPQFWLPLEATGVLNYFLITRQKSQSPVRKIIYAIRRVLWFLSNRLHLKLPVCAIARKPSFSINSQPSNIVSDTVAARDSSNITEFRNELLDTIRTGWGGWGYGNKPDNLSWLLLSGGPRTISKIIALIFAESDDHPRLAVKMPRIPESTSALSKEAENLQALQAHPGGIQGVPRLLFCQQHAGILTLGQSVLTGIPVYSALHRNNYRELALKATTWLVDLAGRSEPCPQETYWNRIIEPVLIDFESSFGIVLDPGMIRESKDILASLGALPIVFEHRDFSPWNLLINVQSELAVLDWESSEVMGLPFLDLIYFLTYLAFYLDGANSLDDFRNSYRATLDPSTFTGKVSFECIQHYLSKIGLNPSILPPLRLLVWLLHSRSEYKHFVADNIGRERLEPELLRNSLFLTLWKEELRHATRM